MKEAWKELTVRVEGTGITESIRAEVGLTDKVYADLKASTSDSYRNKSFAAAKSRGEERRWLYPVNWKDWPESISIKNVGAHPDSTAQSIVGDFHRASCRQTTNQSALWVRKGTGGRPPLYLLIQPNVHRTGPDRGILSFSTNHSDHSAIIAWLPRDWQPCDALDSNRHSQCLKVSTWKSLSAEMKCLAVASGIKVESPEEPDVLLSIAGVSETDVNVLSKGIRSIESNRKIAKLHVSGGQQAQQVVRVFNSVCVAPMLKYIAESGLTFDLGPDGKFEKIVAQERAPFGRDESVVPPRPNETWVYNGERKVMERTSEPNASRNYVLKLQDAKQPFQMLLERSAKRLVVKFFPEVAAHHAAANLIRGRAIDDSHDVAFRLSDTSRQTDPVMSPFVVHNCNSFEPSNISLRKPYALYPRQQKVVTKMVGIEDGDAPFEELEMSEFEMPGAAGLSLIAKASRNRKISGGVIADAIGAGKTIISIAIILRGIENARKAQSPPRKSGATLVVVPPGLIDQWEGEIDKFTTSLSVLKIYDYPSLLKISVGRILDTDVVICPIDILESKGYLKNLIQSAKLGDTFEKDVPNLPTYTGQQEKNAARGVWIPATSADPYGGANNPLSQGRRDQAAYYTYIYTKAIQALREQSFETTDTGVPLEYFEWERIIVDEIHEVRI
jgi:hypothetical protein